MKILFLIDNLGSGGAQRQMTVLSKLFKKEGHNVSFLIYNEGDFFRKIVESEGIPIAFCHSKTYIGRLFKVRNYIRKGNYNVVISFLETPNFLNCFAAIGGKKWKVITNERSSEESSFFSKRGRLFGWFQRFSDLIICNSHNAASMWENYYPKYRNKIDVIYNSVVLPEITSSYNFREKGKTNLVVAASYRYLKNSLNLVQALTLLNEEQRGNICINWFGSKGASSNKSLSYIETQNLIEKNELQNTIRLNDVTSDIAEEMMKADVVGLFSRVEGLPNAVCEAMMIGKPIVMTRVSDYHTLIDEKNGILCDWNDIESIKDALLTLIDKTKNDLLSMGKESRRKAENLFLSEIITKKWLEKISNID